MRSILIYSFLIFLSIGLLVFPVSGLSISVSPDHINRGDQVSITIGGLADNSTFGLLLDGSFLVTPGGDFSFETRNFVMPITLENGLITAVAENTEYNILSVRSGDTEVRQVGSSVDGYFSTSTSGNIPAGTYDYIKLEGTAEEGKDSVRTGIQLEGAKKGPEDSVISFTVEGITDGEVMVAIIVDGSTVLTRTIIIGNPLPITTLPTTATPSPTTTTSSGGGSSGGGGTSDAAVVTSVPSAAETTSSQSSGTATTIQTTTEVTAAVTAETTSTTTPIPTQTTGLSIVPIIGAGILILHLYRSRP